MARLMRATEGSDVIPTGFPVLVTEKLEIIEPVFDYLLEIATLHGRTASPLTVKAYAEHLLDWFDSLEQSEVDWELVTKEMLASYRRRHQMAPSPVTGRNYAPATINGRLRTVARFYQWAAEAGWIETMPFPREAYPSMYAGTGFLGHTRRRGRASERNLLTVSQPRASRRSLSAGEIQRLMEALAEPYRTMAAWAITTGMRRMELCALTTVQIPDAMTLRERDGRLIEIRLTVTKGRRPRSVYAPLELIDRTHRYIQGARAEAARARRGRRSQRLFLGPRGVPVSFDRASKKFHEGFKRAGVEGDLHCLRHSFAMMTYNSLTKRQRAGEPINVMMILRDLLGHSSVAVVETYLSSLEMRPETIEPTLAYLYGAVIEEETAGQGSERQ